MPRRCGQDDKHDVRGTEGAIRTSLGAGLNGRTRDEAELQRQPTLWNDLDDNP
jgi:hypothetical protein